MSERDDYLSYVGDIAGQAEENLLNGMCDDILNTLAELRHLLNKKDYLIVKEKFEKNFPIKIL